MDNKELNDLEALELSAEDLEHVAGGKLDKKFLSSTMAGITLLTGSPNFSNTKAASSSLSGSDFSTQISAKVEKEEKQEVKPKSESKVNESKSIMKVDYDYDAKTGKLIINKVFKYEVTRSAIEDILTAEDIKADDIKKIEIKDGVLTLAEGCFEGLKNLESVELPDSLDTIGNYAFYGCSKLEKIFLPKRIRGIGREAIGASNVIMYDSKVWKFPYLNILEERAGFLDRICHKNTTVTIIIPIFQPIMENTDPTINPTKPKPIVNINDLTEKIYRECTYTFSIYLFFYPLYTTFTFFKLSISMILFPADK